MRSTSSTKSNDQSSRSHFLFRLKITGINEAAEQRTEGELNLVDLAGSERIKDSQVSGKALEEAKFINKSLTSLGDVISGERAPQPHACARTRAATRARRFTRHEPTARKPFRSCTTAAHRMRCSHCGSARGSHGQQVEARAFPQLAADPPALKRAARQVKDAHVRQRLVGRRAPHGN